MRAISPSDESTGSPWSRWRNAATCVLFMLGEDPLDIAAQMGHTDPTTTVKFYARVMAGLSLVERDRIRGQLRELADGFGRSDGDVSRGLERVGAVS